MSHFVYADPKLCIGCDTCLAACAEAHIASGANPRPRLAIVRSALASTPVTCRQCDNAPCVSICPQAALTMTSNGIQLDESLCNGCNLCVPACPFGIMALTESSRETVSDDGTGLLGAELDNSAFGSSRVAVKCDCNIAKKGAECVNACPTKALWVVDPKSIRRDANAKRKAAASAVPVFLSFPPDKK